LILQCHCNPIVFRRLSNANGQYTGTLTDRANQMFRYTVELVKQTSASCALKVLSAFSGGRGQEHLRRERMRFRSSEAQKTLWGLLWVGCFKNMGNRG
jgi:hypothetical protein